VPNTANITHGVVCHDLPLSDLAIMASGHHHKRPTYSPSLLYIDNDISIQGRCCVTNAYLYDNLVKVSSISRVVEGSTVLQNLLFY
jgi:hypothetical protein